MLPVPDLWIRGTGALLIVAAGIAVLALLERSTAFGIYTAGFVALALLSCLYDEINVLGRLGLGGPFAAGGEELPNLLIPGLYLLVGGACFGLAARRTGRSRRLGPTPGPT